LLGCDAEKTPRMRIIAAGLTDVGLQREHNEDAFSILAEHGLFLVADGMGGHRSGEVASGMVAESMQEFFETTAKEDATWPFPIDPNLSLAENRLAGAIKYANKRIFDRSLTEAAVQGMGTTVVGILTSTEPALAHVAHVGDSRVYRLREGKLLQLTRDHSLVNDYMMMVPDMPKEAMDILPKNVITRALGNKYTIDIELGHIDYRPGDVFLVCSDGLSSMLSNHEIEETMRQFGGRNAEALAKRLIEQANVAGLLRGIGTAPPISSSRACPWPRIAASPRSPTPRWWITTCRCTRTPIPSRCQRTPAGESTSCSRARAPRD